MDLHSSSSSFSYAFTYDAFLSFRGSDTRHSFTGNLYRALRVNGIHTFIDDEELQRGNEITEALVKAIQESRIAILVFSVNYASSSFCLDELVTIVDYVKKMGRLVLPVFYNVDPSDLRHHLGSYGEALAKHEARFKNNEEKLKRLQKWKTALTQAANLSGFHYKHGDGYEHVFIGNIVEEVSKRINRVPLHVADYPVGLESQVLEVNLLLDVGSDLSDDGVHMIGIHGIGGGGKTTLASAIYNSVADSFEGLCFLENIRENSNKHGLQHLQSILLSKIVGENNITSVRKGMSIIKHRLQRKKVLLIMDDVDKQEQLQAIAGGVDWFGAGSRIIITTRDQHLLACNDVKRTYEVKGLNEEDALRLLNWKAFKSENVDPSYGNVLNRAITYASGLPLALEVIGSNLYGKSLEEWESAIDQYERIPNNKILEIIKISFDALGEEEKKIFLDIGCFFKGYNLERVERMLHAHHGYRVKHHISVLLDKSLIKIVPYRGQITLHDLIEHMAKEIVRQESRGEPGERSRLWFHEDIVHVLEDNKGSEKIEIIYLQFPFEEKGKEVEWDGDAFTKMKNLKTLVIRDCSFLNSPKHLPNSLRVLEWEKYPWQDLPHDFHPKKLTICELSQSCLASANFVLRKEFPSLTILNLNSCEYLTEIPDVSNLPNLKNLSLHGCTNLSTIHHSVGLLCKLKNLSVGYCCKLKSFPPMKLTSLERLILEHSGLESFPEVLEEMPNIKQLLLSRVPIKKIPHSFQNLVGLEFLQMNFPGKLSDSDADSFPHIIVTMPKLTVIASWGVYNTSLIKASSSKVSSSTIQIIKLENCNLTDEFFPVVVKLFANVKELVLPGNNFIIVPECIKECIFLKKLFLRGCQHLQEIRGIPPNLKHFNARDCESLIPSCRRMFLNQDLHEAGNTLFSLPATTEIPKWFEHRSRKGSISFWFRNNFPRLVLYIRLDTSRQRPLFFEEEMILNGKKYESPNEVLSDTNVTELTVHEFWINDSCNLNEWNRAELTYKEQGLEDVDHMLAEIGIHVLKEKCSMEDVRFTDPYRKRKLEDYLNTAHPQNNRFPKKHKSVDMENCKTQFEKQQDMGLLWRMWNWVSCCFPFLPAPPMHSLDDSVNEDLSSMAST